MFGARRYIIDQQHAKANASWRFRCTVSRQ